METEVYIWNIFTHNQLVVDYLSSSFWWSKMFFSLIGYHFYHLQPRQTPDLNDLHKLSFF